MQLGQVSIRNGLCFPVTALISLYLFIWPPHGIWSSQARDQIELSCSLKLSCSCGSTRSLTHHAWSGIEPMSQSSKTLPILLCHSGSASSAFNFSVLPSQLSGRSLSTLVGSFYNDSVTFDHTETPSDLTLQPPMPSELSHPVPASLPPSSRGLFALPLPAPPKEGDLLPLCPESPPPASWDGKGKGQGRRSPSYLPMAFLLPEEGPFTQGRRPSAGFLAGVLEFHPEVYTTVPPLDTWPSPLHLRWTQAWLPQRYPLEPSSLQKAPGHGSVGSVLPLPGPLPPAPCVPRPFP